MKHLNTHTQKISYILFVYIQSELSFNKTSEIIVFYLHFLLYFSTTVRAAA